MICVSYRPVLLYQVRRYAVGAGTRIRWDLAVGWVQCCDNVPPHQEVSLIQHPIPLRVLPPIITQKQGQSKKATFLQTATNCKKKYS